MDYRVILTKIITLIYRSRLIDNIDSDDLARTVLNTIKVDSPEYSFNGHNVVKQLKEFIIELLEEKDPIAKEVIIQRLSILLENDTKLLEVIKESILPEHDDPSNKRIVTSLIKLLNNYYREYLATELINKVSYDLKFNRSKINNFSDYLKSVISELEPLTTTISTLKDPALINEVDFENTDSLNVIFEDIKSLNSNKGIYRTGWQAINRMLQGGIRRGEFITVGALQHKYKTGFTLSLFMQIALYNKPVITKEETETNKKPLLLRISFEDSLTNNLQFMYQYLKAKDGIIIKKDDFASIPTQEMSEFIHEKLTANGFYIKMMRVDPSKWTYLSVINKVLELEAQGYSIHVLMLDYITMISNDGAKGPIGSDKKDLIRRIRTFCSARNITCITPLQLSSEAKMLIRNGVPDHQFVNEMAGKGYYDGCKSLDTEIDCELFLHYFNYKRKSYIALRLSKHRLPTVIPEEFKYCLYRFANFHTPILDDIDSEDSSFSKLPKDIETQSDNILQEILN